MFPYLTPLREREKRTLAFWAKKFMHHGSEQNETLQTEICIRIWGIRTEITLHGHPLVTGKSIHISYFTQSRTETGRRRFGTGQR